MNDLLNKIIGDLEGKKEWKEMEARAKALPEEYHFVYSEMKQYIWRAAGTGSIDALKDLLQRFEEGAARGGHVLEITGENVAAFADTFVHNDNAYAEDRRAKLNSVIAKKLGK